MINMTAMNNIPFVNDFCSEHAINVMVKIIQRVSIQSIVDYVFWIYNNIMGEKDNRNIRNFYVFTPLFKKNLERCVDTNIKHSDKTNSINNLFVCVRCLDLGEWVNFYLFKR